MDDRIKYMLLKILSKNGNIDDLEKAGYQYAHIANIYSQLINEGLVVPNKKLQFVLSPKGEEEMKYLFNYINKSGQWKIELYSEYKIEKMDKYDIFIE